MVPLTGPGADLELSPTGLRAFYKGMSFPLGAQLIFKAVIFSTNGAARRALEKRGLADSRAGVYACGALGGGSGQEREMKRHSL